MSQRVRVLVEAAPRKVFVCALDWPGWARSGRDEDRAVAAFLAAAPRYAAVAAAAGLPLPAQDLKIDVVERGTGDSGTEFGVPSRIADADREPVDPAEAVRLARLVEASWATFDRIATAAPEALRKGPRGGGRDRSKIVDHVNGADAAYAGVMGLKRRPDDRVAIGTMRRAMLDVLDQPSDGSPIAGRRWPPRYAARRIAWHALDHAWEIEDRTDPA